MTQKFYAGIGSRRTPDAIIAQMKLAGAMLAIQGYTLRSGMAPRSVPYVPGTDSADLAFEAGCDSVSGAKVIRCTSMWEPALTHAAAFHPNWQACNEHARSLHARNSLIMLGDTLDTPVAFVACYTDGGGVVGGTGQALRIARHLSIPVFNYATDGDLFAWLRERGL